MATIAVDRLQTLAARLQAARQAQHIYPDGHPQLDQAVADCFDAVSEALQNGRTLRIAFADDEFVYENTQIPAESGMLAEFASMLGGLDIQKLVFRPGLRRDELERFLKIVGKDAEEVKRAGGMKRVLADARISNIAAGSLAARSAKRTVRRPSAENLFRTWEAYSKGLKVLNAVKGGTRASGRLERTGEIKQFAYQLTDLAMKEARPLLAVHSLMEHDDYSFTHSVNVAMLTLAIADKLPFSDDQRHDIAVAALLHDVGKERIPPEVLNKPGKLDAEEWEIVNRHGMDGARMLVLADDVGDLAPIVAYEHHLSYHEELQDDPDWQPHIASQIVALADVYDALRSNRPYRTGMPPDRAMHIMENDDAKKFNPVLFEGFREMVGLYPPGTLVKLTDGTLAVSVAVNPGNAARPHALVVRDPDGEMLASPSLLNLADPALDVEVDEVVDAEEVGIDPLSYL